MEWISVNDRLPDAYQEVIATDGASYYLLEYDMDSFWLDRQSELHTVDEITHWTTLPYLPRASGESKPTITNDTWIHKAAKLGLIR